MANLHDSQVLEDLLHEEETRMWGNTACTDQTEAIRRATPDDWDFTHEKDRLNQPLNAAT